MTASATPPSRTTRRALGRACVIVVTIVGLMASADPAAAVDSRQGASSLATVEESPTAESESTIVEVPVIVTLRKPDDGRIGYRLRLSVFFSWDNVRFEDISGGDIEQGLNTLTVVPGFELMVPVGERWMVRPYAQIGGLTALDIDGNRWMASLGSRATATWRFDRWIPSVGGRFEYTAVFDDDFVNTDDVGFVDVGADFSFPLWFDVMGERAAAGFYVIPRWYFSRATLVGLDGFDLGVDAHLEVGASFRMHTKPKLWFVTLPRWYGIGGRFADNHRSLRIYFGFPF